MYPVPVGRRSRQTGRPGPRPSRNVWARGSRHCATTRPLTVRVRMEGPEPHPQWYAHVCYAVPAAQARQPAADGALGLDRNVGQATDSEDTVYALPDTNRLDARIARKQRELRGPQDRRPQSHRGRRVNGQLRKLHRKLAYKAGALLQVDPASTSQTCRRCGHGRRHNRPSPAVFACGACGFRGRTSTPTRRSTCWRGRPFRPVPVRPVA